MKNKIPALCAVLLLLLALSVCGCGANVSGSDASTASEPEELVLTDASGLEVTVQGSEISVSAPADETIGYATADRKLQGFTFKAQRPGRTVIELTYAQAWSGGTIDKILLLSCRVDEDLTVTAEFL